MAATWIMLSMLGCDGLLGIEDLGRGLGGSDGNGGTLSGGSAGVLGGGGNTAGMGGRPASLRGGSSSTAGEGSLGGAGEAGGSGRAGDEGGAGTPEAGSGGGGAVSDTAGASGSGAASGSGGASGSDGTGGPREPRLDHPCEAPGSLACAANNPSLVLECTGGIWDLQRTCSAHQRCAVGRGAGLDCAEIDDRCSQPFLPHCTAEAFLDCSDPLRPVDRMCPFGCQDGACLPGVGDQLTLHTEKKYFTSVLWPSPIEVCFENRAQDDTLRRAWVQGEVEAAWARYLHVTFSGWQDCTERASGVIVRFAEACRERLTNSVSIGFDGDLEIIEICASYFDAAGDETISDEATLRLVARHQFGHLLGLFDYPPGDHSTMVLGFERSRVESIVVTHEDYRLLYEKHPRKPPMSIVSTRGDCLEAIEGEVRAEACSKGGGAQAWSFPDGFLVNFDDTHTPLRRVRVPAAGEPVTLGQEASSDPSTRWWLRRARWSSPERCVAARSLPPGAGDPLILTECAPVGSAAQAFHFDILQADATFYEARIELAETGYCVTVPDLLRTDDAPLELRPCESSAGDATGPSSLDTRTRQTLRLYTTGLIQFGQRCLRWGGDLTMPGPGFEPDAALFLGGCGLTGSEVWIVSGPIENSNGLVLTLSEPGTRGSVVTATPLDGLPREEQIFDVYF